MQVKNIFISVFEDESKVRKQIKSAVTDTGEVDPNKMSDGISNLFELLKASGDSEGSSAQLMTDYKEGKLKYSDLKESVANSVVAMLKPFKEKRAELASDKRALKIKLKHPL